MDKFSIAKRSDVMRSVPSTNTSAERMVGRALSSLGVRPLQNVATLPGKPDFVLPRARLALFVNGCFWHGHCKCSAATLPRANFEYWKDKVDRNRRRDNRVRRQLRKLGWRTAVIWECKLKNEEALEHRLKRLIRSRKKLR